MLRIPTRSCMAICIAGICLLTRRNIVGVIDWGDVHVGDPR